MFASIMALAGVAVGAVLGLLSNLVSQRSAHKHDTRARELATIRDMRRERIAPILDLVREMEDALAYRAQKMMFEQAMTSSSAAKLLSEDRREELRDYLQTYMMHGVQRNEAVVSLPLRALALIPRVNDLRLGNPLVDVAFTLQTDQAFDVGECAMKLVAVHEELERYVAGAS